MKILILSCSTGEGHNSAARAVVSKAIEMGHEVEVLDILQFGKKKTNSFLASSLNAISKNTPFLFGILYKAGTWYSATKIKSPIYLINGAYSKKLEEYAIENHFDSIVCSHLYAMEALTHLKKHNKLDIPCYGVLTDYTCIPFLEETLMDGFFIPHEDLIAEVVSHGIEVAKIYPTGIPVDSKFAVHMPVLKARKKLHILPDKKVIMIMTGGIGCGNIQGIINKLLKEIDSSFMIFAFVGKNSKLKKELDLRYEEERSIRIISFTEKVNIYMKASDVLITKPGGISTTEAAVSNIPLVHAMAIPGCETKNAAFFASNFLSYNAKDETEAAAYALNLINDKSLSEKMIENQRKKINPNAAYDIIRIIEKNYGNNKNN